MCTAGAPGAMGSAAIVKAPYFIRLIVRRALLLLFVSLSIPIVGAITVFKSGFELNEPEKGWRMRANPIAEAMDALVLVFRQPHDVPEVVQNSILSGRRLTAPQSRSLNHLELITYASPSALEDESAGENMLTATRLAETLRIQRATRSLLRDVCKLDVGTQMCVPVDSIVTRLFMRPTNQSEDVLLCDPDGPRGLPAAEACVQRRLTSARFIAHAGATLRARQAALLSLGLWAREQNDTYLPELINAASDFAAAAGVDEWAPMVRAWTMVQPRRSVALGAP